MQLSLLDVDRWSALVRQARLPLFYSPNYLFAAASWEGGSPQCLFTTKGNDFFLYPYIKHGVKNGYVDIQSPYGYCGPFFHGNWSSKMQCETLAQVATFFKKEKAVAEFIRFDTDYFPKAVLEDAGYELKLVRTNVECDLMAPDHESVSYNTLGRRNIRKAKRFGLRYKCIACPSDREISIFSELYSLTASRIGMDKSYCFNLKYFNDLFSVSDAVKLILVYSESEPIAGAVVLIDQDRAFYFLGGSNLDYRDRRPNDFAYYAMAREAKSMGAKKIIWGGGTGNDPDDTLYKFKTHYGKTHVPVFVGGRIINKGAYEDLCRTWAQRVGPERAQKYGSRVLKYRF